MTGTRKTMKKKTVDQKDHDYLIGRSAAYGRILSLVAEELGWRDANDPRALAARLLDERRRVVAKLREICEDHGDNEWEDNDDLADVLDNNLLGWLTEPHAEGS